MKLADGVAFDLEEMLEMLGYTRQHYIAKKIFTTGWRILVLNIIKQIKPFLPVIYRGYQNEKK